MNNSPSIRLLGSTGNERGDLFTRLARDLFFSLGYDNLALDLPVPGRELDIQGEHRFEPRRVIAECKAHTTAMGGADLNKFFGILARERKKHSPQAVAGYFVSLGGFTGTSIQQEKESGDDAIILFDASKVLEELQRGRVVVPLVDAAARAGQCAEANALAAAQLEKAELLGHTTGYLWVLYFTQGKHRTHFAIVHADGTALAAEAAEKVILADRGSGGTLHTLAYLAPAATEPDAAQRKARVLAHYRRWLGEECGYIQLDGLPADNDLSATKLRLEKLFVPLNATHSREDKTKTVPTRDDGEFVEPIGRLLDRSGHLALLASPGGGKSTLLKRLATAYAFPERRQQIADDLPERDWLPLYLRCRDLRDRAQRPLLELLYGITAHANMDDAQTASFRSAVSDTLRLGRALLLVDGLDEISDEGARRSFAQNLRTFVAMFPQIALVVTSRVAGFRDVAGVIAGICKQATIAPLDENDVKRLCVNWHVEVIVDNDKIRTDATELAATIWRNPHTRALVENPLLLTTLLVVKRSNGEIPPNRGQLYQEAVRVLVRTWNVEGYAPLDEGETLARLSYIACNMMERGTQVIGHRGLIRLLNEAGDELEAELQFANVSPTEFIRRIEYRSSLLMQTGYQRIDDEMQPVFEFRHLTFQEYLAARGFVAEQYPGRSHERPLVELFAPHFQDERWQEVIPLAAVLAGRKAETIVQRLTAECVQCVASSSPAPKAVRPKGPRGQDRRQPTSHPANARERVSSLLMQCLLHEVTVSQATLRSALVQVGYYGVSSKAWSFQLRTLAAGKFGKTLRSIVESTYLEGLGDWSHFDFALAEILWQQAADLPESASFAGSIDESLRCGTRDDRIRAALLLAYADFHAAHAGSEGTKRLMPFAVTYFKELSTMLMSGDLPSVKAACWAMAWLGTVELWPGPTPLEHRSIVSA